MSIATTPPPGTDEFNEYYLGYVSLVPAGDLVTLLRTQGDDVRRLVADAGESRGGYRYAPAKWSIREVVGHMSDTERIFSYRALRIARNDPTPLASFDENAYADIAGHDAHTLAALADEWSVVRNASVALFASLDDAALVRRGTASGHTLSARAAGFITYGHTAHHLRILRERYLGG